MAERIRAAIGIVIGAVVDIASTGLFSTLLTFNRVSAAGLSGEEYERAIERAMLDDPILFGAQLLIGSACSVLGGYMAARIARANELLNGGFSSFLCLWFSIESLHAGNSLLPVWLHVLWFPITPALAVLGGYICLKTKKRRG